MPAARLAAKQRGVVRYLDPVFLGAATDGYNSYLFGALLHEKTELIQALEKV